jgi:hypothetical protein
VTGAVGFLVGAAAVYAAHIIVWAIARLLDRWASTLHCPKCRYKVGGPTQGQYHLEHFGPARHILHGAYGPIAELTNTARADLPADLVSQLRPLSYNATPRPEQ